MSDLIYLLFAVWAISTLGWAFGNLVLSRIAFWISMISFPALIITLALNGGPP